VINVWLRLFGENINPLWSDPHGRRGSFPVHAEDSLVGKIAGRCHFSPGELYSLFPLGYLPTC
jgi:hypothetical protein